MAAVPPFRMYDLRHICLTRWAAHMDPYTLAYLAGHSDFSTTRRYVHPQADTVRAALERVRTLAQLRHESAHRAAKSFRISSGYRRVCTTLAIEFEVLGEVESELAEEFLLFG